MDHRRHSVCRVPADHPDEPQIDDELLRIGQRIRQVRESHGLTQERVFLAVPMNRSHYQEIEAGRANPTLRTLMRIAHAIGVPLADLVG
jgi:transcriptional regulator with XRE-family HTH domain